MGGRDHACERCGHGGLNDPEGRCTCPPEPSVVRAARETIRRWEKRDGHDSYTDCLDGGFRGYQAVCWDCDWRGPEHLRGDEEMETPEGRAHKIAARQEAGQHRADTAAPFIPAAPTAVTRPEPVPTDQDSELAERCPTCGSGNPKFDRFASGDDVMVRKRHNERSAPCPDPYHGTPEGTSEAPESADPVPADIARELYEALERIANTDWTEPPVDLPDEIARAALTRYEREVGG